jgi:hypothetical protein
MAAIVNLWTMCRAIRQTERDRHTLLVEFERRLRYDEAQGDGRHMLLHGDSLAWVVHRLADDEEMLAQFEASPSECRHADAYWRYRGNVYFVEVYARGTLFEPGLYYRFDRRRRQDVIAVCLEAAMVWSDDFHQAFDRLARLIDDGVLETE